MSKDYVLTPEEGVAGKFIHSYVDEYGALKKIAFVNDDDFNFKNWIGNKNLVF